jgi:hypothetical protein
MDSHPYSPPTARVADPATVAEPSDARPRGIAIAVWLLRLLFVGSLPMMVALIGRDVPFQSVPIILTLALAFPAVLLALSWPVSAGRTWARVLTLVCTPVPILYAGGFAFGMVIMLSSDVPGPSALQMFLFVVLPTSLQAVGLVVASCLLWRKSARQWFRERRRR